MRERERRLLLEAAPGVSSCSAGGGDFEFRGFLTVRELLLLESRRRRRDEFDGEEETEEDERGITNDASMSTTRLGCSSATGDSASVLTEVKDV